MLRSDLILFSGARSILDTMHSGNGDFQDAKGTVCDAPDTEGDDIDVDGTAAGFKLIRKSSKDC